MSCICRGSMLLAMVDDAVSSSGASPVTVTASWTPDSDMLISNVTCLPSSNSTPAREDGLNPESSAVILNDPARTGMRYRPRSRTRQAEASFVAVWSPGITAPVLSFTVPINVHPARAPSAASSATANQINRPNFISVSPCIATCEATRPRHFATRTRADVPPILRARARIECEGLNSISGRRTASDRRD